MNAKNKLWKTDGTALDKVTLERFGKVQESGHSDFRSNATVEGLKVSRKDEN